MTARQELAKTVNKHAKAAIYYRDKQVAQIEQLQKGSVQILMDYKAMKARVDELEKDQKKMLAALKAHMALVSNLSKDVQELKRQAAPEQQHD